MMLPEKTPAQLFTIWQPRWKDRTVLLAKYKLGAHNIVEFTKAKSMAGQFYISGETAQNYPIESNGKLTCYCVPLDALEPFEGRHAA